MLIIIFLLIFLYAYAYAVNHEIGLGEAFGRVFQFLFDVLALLMLMVASFICVYLSLRSLGVEYKLNEISIVVGAIGAIWFFHRSNRV